jgi:DNA topoisomerase-2
MATDLSQYVMRNELDHVLLNPDTYVGSIENIESPVWIFKDGKIVVETVKYNPALLKLFDEFIVNANDHFIRTKDGSNPVTHIQVQIQENGTITITNDGEGIDVAEHPEHKVFIPQLIFATLRTSRNFNTEEKRIVGGKNGFGVKLGFIWSTHAEIEVVDAVRQLKYNQTIEENMKKINKPTIKSCKKKSYTSITFTPDYARLKLAGLDENMKSIIIRRIYDIAAFTDKSVKLSFNDSVIPIKSFPQYVDMFVGPKTETPRISYICDRWEVIVCKSASEEFTSMAYVNGIHTSKGGTHVNYIINQILKKLIAYILQSKKVNVKPTTIKEYLMLFIKCSIENPSFDSQTKDYLNTPSSAFGSVCEIPDKFVEDIAKKVGIMEIVLSITKSKEMVAAKKSGDGTKTKKISGIPKYIGANYAGTAKSGQCTLILCEGDSARSAILSGFTSDDRNYYGVYPLRGKLRNVREESITTISGNKEIKELMTIMGLKYGKEYTPDSVIELRYSHVLFMTDQDLDGSHIKALCINLVACLWPSLLSIPNFIGFMHTPIIKATKGKMEHIFYTEEQYEEWKQVSSAGFTIKYYKGLGTSTSTEFKKYFLDKKIVHFTCTPECPNQIDMVFNKNRANDRKQWLEQYVPERLNTDVKEISFHDLLNKEVIKFSKYDCDRSIPHIMDGFKISQRKIMFAAFLKPIANEIKVAQFSGYVSEKSSYHHGEQSLNGAIVNLAQDFVGSNNINLLIPSGQFGTRLQGGKDHASERYIFTKLNKCTRNIFNKEDDNILNYLNDDGVFIEPEYYSPIIPMILVNGCDGIGTGFSTKIPCYNPRDLIKYLQNMLHGKPNETKLVPYYRGFKGTIEEKSEGKFIIRGVYTIQDLKVVITELPIGMWTDTYKQFLEDSIGTVIKEYTDKSTDVNIHITITLLAPMTNPEVDLKLTTSISTSNMHLNNAKNQLKKYKTVEDIINEYAEVRLQMYLTRKQHLLQAIHAKLNEITNRVRYIRFVLDGTIDLRHKSSDTITTLLQSLKLEKMNDTYHYLIKMAMDSVSTENVTHLEGELAKLTEEKRILSAMSEKQMWLNELDDLMKVI